jgi:hypothetical protein
VAAAKTTAPKTFTGDDAVFTKRRCFEHEKELRLAMYINDIKKPVLTNDIGLKIQVDLKALVSEILVSPQAPPWLADLAQRITCKYGFSWAVKQSTLNQLVF